ncbi:MAG: hypothetical protein RPS47_04950 [Colwellia sp.]
MKQVLNPARVVVACGTELYHLEKARFEFGDRQVINKLADQISQRESITIVDAFGLSSRLLSDVDKLKNNEFQFKEMRNDLAASRKGVIIDGMAWHGMATTIMGPEYV